VTVIPLPFRWGSELWDVFEHVGGDLKDPGLTEACGVLSAMPCLHPDRPRGSKAMVDAWGAKRCLVMSEPGARVISPLTNRIWARWPGGEIDWLPPSVLLPSAAKVVPYPTR
jgi:hypothetical protein